MDSSLISRTARMSGSSSTTSARAALTAGSSWLGAHDGARHLGGHPPSGQAHDEPATTGRSGEHTSELPSPCNIVCRPLLEKKKTDTYHTETYFPALLSPNITFA